jgi:hypothetical protein
MLLLITGNWGRRSCPSALSSCCVVKTQTRNEGKSTEGWAGGGEGVGVSVVGLGMRIVCTC